MSYIVSITWMLIYNLLPISVGFNVDTENGKIYKGQAGSYFGISIALLKNSAGTWIVVGAPKAGTVPGVEEPGAIYKCNTQNSNICQQIQFNDTINKNCSHQWFGVSLAVASEGTGQLLACSHKWKWYNELYPKHFHEAGKCFTINNQLEEKSALKYTTLAKHHSNFFYYSFGQAGFSTHFAKGSGAFLIGTPGLRTWTGGLIVQSTNATSNAVVFFAKYMYRFQKYVGYSLTSGMYYTDRKTYYVDGGPKYKETGMVTVRTNASFIEKDVKMGFQLGEYFGASVCTSDLNGDGFDDLLVGAPHHIIGKNTRGEHGTVYVYMSDGDDLVLDKKLSGSGIVGARFGSAITNIGDINKDQYDDVAIGAPYESNHGSIYIYHGSVDGIRHLYSQRILGSSFGLKGFGCSISNTMDVDANGYQDIAVGAYLSDAIVLLKTRPVVDLTSTLSVHPREITQNHTNCVYNNKPSFCLNVTVCIQYNGTDVPDIVNVQYNLSIDTLLPLRQSTERAHFINESVNTLSSISYKMELVPTQEHCISYKVLTKRNIRILTPLQITLDTGLLHRSNHIQPILNKYTSKSQHLEESVLYIKDCGKDDVCITDLGVNAQMLNTSYPYILGSSNTLMFSIYLQNLRENSYTTILTVKHHHSVIFINQKHVQGKTEALCEPAGVKNLTAIVLCDAGHPFYGNSSGHFIMTFDSSRLILMESLEFSIGIATGIGSTEDNSTLADNTYVMTIPLRMQVNLEISGASIPDTVFPNRLQNNVSHVDIVHQYLLLNEGPSATPNSQLDIIFPVSIDGLILLSSVPVVTIENNGHKSIPFTCQNQSSELDSSEVSIACYVTSLPPGSDVLLSISAPVSVPDLQAIRNKKSGLFEIISNLSWTLTDHPLFINTQLIKRAQVTTLILENHRPADQEHLKYWIIAAGVGGGLFLLIIITIVLWKCKFFQRKKKEDLRRLTEEDENDNHGKDSNSYQEVPMQEDENDNHAAVAY